MAGKYSNKPMPGVGCCFCEETIQERGINPCDMTITANWDKHKDKQVDQDYWCHFECFQKKVHPIVESAFVEPLQNIDTPTKMLEGACSFCLQKIESTNIDPCNIHFVTSWYESRAEQRRCNFACHLECLRGCMQGLFKKYLCLHILVD